MQLDHSFSVPTEIQNAWSVLLDVERVAPCMPGAVLESVAGDTFEGTVKLKLGPISLAYKGVAKFVETDIENRRVVIDARGRDARGNGTAAARISATLSESGDRTNVDILTQLDITGKPAQFGRGVMVDVGNKLIEQFAQNLAATIARGHGSDTAISPRPEVVKGVLESTGGSTRFTGETGTDINHHVGDTPSISLLTVAGPALAKRAIPILLAVVAGAVAWSLARR